jgi:GrpB-like predicted nucleotidyltransferase (UPF0157 family)
MSTSVPQTDWLVPLQSSVVDDSGRVVGSRAVGAPVVEVAAYDPTWPERFAAERRRLAGTLPYALSIEHIGSTSVPGLAAKPIIDMVVVVPEVSAVTADVSGLERLGYVFRPLAFPDDDEHAFFARDTGGRRTHHLHVFASTSSSPQQNRIFRAYLVAHPEAARRYAAAKRKAAQLCPDSRARYADAKEAVMLELVEEARRWGLTA